MYQPSISIFVSTVEQASGDDFICIVVMM